MKKLLLILLCLPMIGFGQYINSTSVWLVSDSDAFTWQSNDYQYFINGSTTINLNVYNNIYMQGFNTNQMTSVTTPISAGPYYLREDGLKWYVYNQTTGIDELLCDFSLNIGDNIGSFTAASFQSPAPVVINITNVTLFGSSVRQKFHLDNGFSFIEGVGNLAGLFSDYIQWIEYGSYLNCYIQDNINWSGVSDSNCIPIYGCTFTQTDESSSGACDGSISVNVIGCPAPYTYDWLGQNPLELCSGTYTVIITDANMNNCCTDTIVINVTPPSAIQEQTTNKKLLKVTDLLGREKKGTKNKVLFYIYDDGTVEKRIVIE